MMRSLYSGVSGMQNHQTRMDVIGNNVANVNTTGFKRGRVNFQDLISQQLNGASRPTENLGGVNPKEVGLGMMVATIDTVHTQGALQTTGINTDISVQGNGFFVLKDGEKMFYTRDGAFGVDRDGTLVNPANGMRVQGWMVQEAEGARVLNTSGNVEDLIIPIGQKLDAKVYDSFGNTQELTIAFARVPGTTNQWQGTVNVLDPMTGANTETRTGVGTTDGVGNTFLLEFDNYGHLLQVTDTAGNVTNEGGQVMLQVSYNVPEATAGADGNPTRGNFMINLGQTGTSKNSVTQFAETSTTKAYTQDGYAMGYLENFKIDNSGVITGVYSNGIRQDIGQIAMASFSNQGGLEKAGENTYVESNNSGYANISTSGTVGKGKLIAGTLEMSNVDLADQFVDMIVTQRGFQGNAKTIQTSDTMLETALSLKR